MDLFGARNVVLYVVIGEVLAACVAQSTYASSGAPPGAIDLEDSIGVAGSCLWASYQSRIQSALALHQADPIAHVSSTDLSLR